MFEKGQRVYSILKGWGEVLDFDNMDKECPVLVVYLNGMSESYTADGKVYIGDINPELYHTEPIITVPKRRVEHKGWIGISKSCGIFGERVTTKIHPESFTEITGVLGKYEIQEITYYTEE